MNPNSLTSCSSSSPHGNYFYTPYYASGSHVESAIRFHALSSHIQTVAFKTISSSQESSQNKPSKYLSEEKEDWTSSVLNRLGSDFVRHFATSVKRRGQIQWPFYCFNPQQCPDPSLLPSQVTTHLWLTARIPPSIYQRFGKITSTSGKFMVFLPVERIDALWSHFLKMYQNDELGWGLQVSTALENPYLKNKDLSCLLVHTEDGLDLKDIARVAYNIFNILGIGFETILQYRLDISTQFNADRNRIVDSEDLYRISSRSWIQGSKYGGTEAKTFSAFERTILLSQQERLEEFQRDWR